MARPKSAQPDDSLRHLERKLAVYARGYPKSSRTAALEILTRGADPNASPEPYAGATYETVRGYLADDNALPSDEPIPLRPALKTTQPDRHPQRFRIERSTPPRRVGRALRYIVVAVATVSILAAGALEFQVLTATKDVPSPTETPAASASAVSSQPAAPQLPDATPLPTPASPSIPVPALQMRLLIDEHFTSNSLGWPNDPTGTAWLANGTYWLAPRQTAHFVAVSIPGARDLSDTVVSAWFHKDGGPDGGGYGLIVRDQAADPLDGLNQLGHYYVFEAGDRGQFGVWLRDGDRWVDLLTWTASEAINRGTAANELTVTATGDQLSFLINGTPVATETDTMLHRGAAGVFVGGDSNQVALDRLSVRVPR